MKKSTKQKENVQEAVVNQLADVHLNTGRKKFTIYKGFLTIAGPRVLINKRFKKDERPQLLNYPASWLEGYDAVQTKA